jgi:hypothetical protein
MIAVMQRSLNPKPWTLHPQAEYKYVDDLASVWCEAAELELGHKNFRRALELMRRATTPPARTTGRRSKEEMEGPVQARAQGSGRFASSTSCYFRRLDVWVWCHDLPTAYSVGALHGWPVWIPRLPSSAVRAGCTA